MSTTPTFATDHGKTVIWKVFILGYEDDDEIYYCSTQEVARALADKLELENPGEIIRCWEEDLYTTIDQINNLKF